jgi:hypothetical protein
VYSGLFRIFWDFIPDVPGLFQRKLYGPKSNILKSFDKCTPMSRLVPKWNADHLNILQLDILIQICGYLVSRKEAFLTKDKFLIRFPDIPVLAIPFYSGISRTGIFTPLQECNPK